MKADWDKLGDSIALHVSGKSTGVDIGNMAACAKADPKRYAEANAKAMKPINEKRAKQLAEAKAKAEAEAAAERERLSERMRQQAENLTKAIDQRLAHHGVPASVKPRKG